LMYPPKAPLFPRVLVALFDVGADGRPMMTMY
jgi:hypothetical protein